LTEQKTKHEELNSLLKTAENEKATLDEKIKELQQALTKLADLEQKNQEME